MGTIYVPNELKERIDFYAKVHGKPLWRVVMDAMTFYEMFNSGKLRRKDGTSEFPELAKAIWYSVKISMAVGALKADTRPERAESVQRVIKQIKERLGINTSLFERALYDYIQLKLDPNANPEYKKDVEIELTNALKLLVLEIIYKALQKEEKQTNEKHSQTIQTTTKQ